MIRYYKRGVCTGRGRWRIEDGCEVSESEVSEADGVVWGRVLADAGRKGAALGGEGGAEGGEGGELDGEGRDDGEAEGGLVDAHVPLDGGGGAGDEVLHARVRLGPGPRGEGPVDLDAEGQVALVEVVLVLAADEVGELLSRGLEEGEEAAGAGEALGPGEVLPGGQGVLVEEAGEGGGEGVREVDGGGGPLLGPREDAGGLKLDLLKGQELAHTPQRPLHVASDKRGRHGDVGLELEGEAEGGLPPTHGPGQLAQPRVAAVAQVGALQPDGRPVPAPPARPSRPSCRFMRIQMVREWTWINSMDTEAVGWAGDIGREAFLGVRPGQTSALHTATNSPALQITKVQ